MRLPIASLVVITGLLVPLAFAQKTPLLAQTAPSMSVPRLVSISGEFLPADGGQPATLEAVTLGIYADETGGTPLWQETQRVAIDSLGFYTVLLGATEREGVPSHVFGSGEARWLGIAWSRAGEVEGVRTRLTSVPYALRAADAETLGGLPASAYQLASGQGVTSTPAGVGSLPAGVASMSGGVASMPGGREGILTGRGGTGTDSAGNVVPKVVNAGTTNRLAKYVNSADVGNSTVYEINGLVGFNTTTPQDVIHSRFTNSDGTLTGLAVQNLGSTASSYSGMLFYDQVGALAQFQGFNNATHEYRINNVASGGSINFMLGGVSRLLVAPSGNIGIGVASPGAKLQIDTPTSSATAVSATNSFSGNSDGFAFSGTSVNNPGFGIGGRFEGGWRGVIGIASGSTYTSTGYGVWGQATGSAGTRYGVRGEANTSTGTTTAYGVYGTASGAATNWAGYFAGNTNVTGTLSKGGGAFKIDHPLDPQNKYLMHSFVESPDMMNVYNGNIMLDARGEAIVLLPEWFEALNDEFRYQLTSIGVPAPSLYVAEEVAGNKFKIAGGTPNAKVSWQVTGIRQDAWAKQNRILTEVAKSGDEKGRYLHPSAYGLPKEMGVTPDEKMSRQ